MSDSHADSIPMEELFKRWGFDSDVFVPDEARKEKRLGKIFKYPSWFFEVLGNASNTDFSVVVGHRGAGKSAVRRFIAEHCETELGARFLKGNVLCITIDHDVPYWIESLPRGSEPFDAFCSELASLIAIGIAHALLEKKELTGLVKSQKQRLLRYIARLASRRPEETSEMLMAVQDRFSRVYQKVKSSELLTDVVKVVTGGDADIRPDVSEHDGVFTHADEDVASLVRTSRMCGFDAVYVLIDEIDEHKRTMNNPRKAAELIAPVLSSLRLLEMDGIAFKFFLSKTVFAHIQDMCVVKKLEIRWDRTMHRIPYILEWSEDDIAEMLKKRLLAYSIGGGNEVSLNVFGDEAIEGGIEAQIVESAYRSPRHFIQFAQTICRYTARVANATNNKITAEVLDRAKKEYFRWVADDLYGEACVNSMIRLQMTEFSNADFLKKLRLPKKKGQEALDALALGGALKRIAEIGSVTYTVSDPRLIYLMNENSC